MRICAFLTFALAVLVTALPTLAQPKMVADTVPLDAEGTVSVDTYKGSITITTWDRNEVSFEVRIEADEDEALVDLVEINVDHSRRTLRLKTDYEAAKRHKKKSLFDNWGSISLPYAHYTIKMPRTARVDVDDYKSTIRITNVAADVSIDTYKGPLILTDIQGRLSIDTYKSDVEIDHLDGALKLDTYKGNITATLTDLSDDVSIETYKGRVNMTLEKSAGFTLRADMGRRGRLDADFDLGSLKRRDNHYSGSVNGGGPRLSLETHAGQFKLDTR